MTAASLPIGHADDEGYARFRSWLAYIAVLIGFLSLNFNMVTVTGSIASGDQAGPAIKFFHCVFAGLGVMQLLRGRVLRPRPELVLYFSLTLACSLIASMAFGLQRANFYLVVALYAGLIAGGLGLQAGEQRSLLALRLASGVALVAVVIKAALNAQAFALFFANPDGHPHVPTFYVGGANLEATWIALAAVFFIGSRWLFPYAAVALAVSLLYASRVGVIVIALVTITAIARTVGESAEIGGGRRLVRIMVSVGTLATVALVLTVFAQVDGVSYVFERFQGIGDEPGSVGRITLWKGGIAVLAEHPYGVGLGNAVSQIRHITGVVVPEDNLHNLYLQHLVEGGLPSLATYLFFALMTWRRYRAGRYQDRLLAYVLCYLVVGMIQFSGADPMLWFVYGLQSGIARSAEASNVV